MGLEWPYRLHSLASGYGATLPWMQLSGSLWFPSRLCWADDWSLLQMMAKKIPAIRFSKMKYVCVAVLVALTFISPSRAIWPEKNPAEAVRNFYAWYVHEVVNGSRPLEKEREQMRT